MIDIISFRVTKVNHPFNILNLNYKGNKPEWNIIDINSTPYNLSLLMTRQIKWEYNMLINIMRKNGTFFKEIHRYDSGFTPFEDIDEILYEKIEGYFDVFGRDYSVYNDKLEVETYCIIAIEKGKYLGHIYSWISPQDTNICLAMGIRSALDNSRKGLSKFLLEGVRRFALVNGCNKIMIPRPLPVMIEILNNLGFEEQEFPDSIGGISINVHKEDELQYPSTYMVLDKPIYQIEKIQKFMFYI